MKLTQEQYARLCARCTPPTPSHRNVPAAFLVGGGICAFGQALRAVFDALGLNDAAAGAAVSCTLVFLGVLLTGLGVFEKLARFAGAGTLVPITGFANSIAAPAIEFRSEGLTLGTCVKMFSIAGPVLTFGTAASVIYGVIYWLVTA